MYQSTAVLYNGLVKMLALLVSRAPSPFGSGYTMKMQRILSVVISNSVQLILSHRKNTVGCNQGIRVNTVLLHLLQASGPPLPPLDQDHDHVLTSHSQQSTNNRLSFSEGTNIDIVSMMSTSLTSIPWYDLSAMWLQYTNCSIVWNRMHSSGQRNTAEVIQSFCA